MSLSTSRANSEDAMKSLFTATWWLPFVCFLARRSTETTVIIPIGFQDCATSAELHHFKSSCHTHNYRRKFCWQGRTKCRDSLRRCNTRSLIDMTTGKLDLSNHSVRVISRNVHATRMLLKETRRDAKHLNETKKRMNIFYNRNILAGTFHKVH